MRNSISMILAPLITVSKGAYDVIQIITFVLIVLASITAVIIILFQPGNSSGVAAISGQSETFLGKEDSHSLVGRLKRATIWVFVTIIVLSIIFFMNQAEFLFGVGAIVL